ncbi:MAG TPA: MFS transporter [Actinomycetes bacterium]|nr:MFS transporter [Actinomycetes bacterium]
MSRRLVVDLTPLRVSADYRRLWLGLSVAQIGQQMTTMAVGIQVYDLTGSSFSVGLVGAAAFFPLLLFGLYGGSISDRHDRRKVALAASTGLWICSLVLVAQSIADVGQTWLLYLVVGAQSACFAVNNPARAAILPRLLGAELLPAANTLTTVTWNVGFTLGPLLGGFIIFASGLPAAYAIDALTFTAALYALFRLPPIPPEADVRKAGWSAVWEGLQFLRTRRNLLMTFLLDLSAMVLAQPRALFPALAATTYGGGARTVGYLSAAPAIGALIGALFSGWLGRVRWQGLYVVIMVCAWGASISLFGLSNLLTWALFFLALSGSADMVSAVFRSTILQVATPDELRGRLQGVFIVVVAGGPRIGDVVAGSAATVLGEQVAIVAGGMACISVALALVAWHRGFIRYDALHPVP